MGLKTARMHTQCPKLRVHPAPGVHIFTARCMIFRGVHPVCARFFSHLLLLYIGRVHGAISGCTILWEVHPACAQTKSLISDTDTHTHAQTSTQTSTQTVCRAWRHARRNGKARSAGAQCHLFSPHAPYLHHGCTQRWASSSSSLSPLLLSISGRWRRRHGDVVMEAATSQ